ncbi:MAG: hypothetical protein H0W88_08080 [Parachlamydiaceae bacterium]|nr:hypothetical protein [Parachlamydiaceae bacterium]
MQAALNTSMMSLSSPGSFDISEVEEILPYKNMDMHQLDVFPPMSSHCYPENVQKAIRMANNFITVLIEANKSFLLNGLRRKKYIVLIKNSKIKRTILYKTTSKSAMENFDHLDHLYQNLCKSLHIYPVISRTLQVNINKFISQHLESLTTRGIKKSKLPHSPPVKTLRKMTQLRKILTAKEGTIILRKTILSYKSKIIVLKYTPKTKQKSNKYSKKVSFEKIIEILPFEIHSICKKDEYRNARKDELNLTYKDVKQYHTIMQKLPRISFHYFINANRVPENNDELTLCFQSACNTLLGKYEKSLVASSKERNADLAEIKLISKRIDKLIDIFCVLFHININFIEEQIDNKFITDAGDAYMQFKSFIINDLFVFTLDKNSLPLSIDFNTFNNFKLSFDGKKTVIIFNTFFNNYISMAKDELVGALPQSSESINLETKKESKVTN